MSTTVFTRSRRSERSSENIKADKGSRLGKLDPTMMKRTYSVSLDVVKQLLSMLAAACRSARQFSSSTVQVCMNLVKVNLTAIATIELDCASHAHP